MARHLRLVTIGLVVALTLAAGAPALAEDNGGTGENGGNGGNGGGSGSGQGKVQSTKEKVQSTEFQVTLTSQQTVLRTVGTDGEITYGWNQLTGTASSDSGDIGVEMLGNVQYVEGSGPVFGFATLKFASLAEVGFRMHGKGVKGSDSTTFTGTLKVIGGTASLIGVKGGGSFTGTRRDELGAAVDFDMTIKLRGVEIG
jgi:hypothetical protein